MASGLRDLSDEQLATAIAYLKPFLEAEAREKKRIADQERDEKIRAFINARDRRKKLREQLDGGFSDHSELLGPIECRHLDFPEYFTD